MSSTLYLINWTPSEITPTLNSQRLAPVPTTAARYEYYPYQISVPRDASGPGQPGVWGTINALIVQPASGGSQIYNDLADPAGAEPNTSLLLWIFPEFLVFSQRETQRGEPVYPGSADPDRALRVDRAANDQRR